MFALLFLLSSVAVGQTHSLEFLSYKAPNKVSFEYVVLKPAHYDHNKAYPALLAFPGGDQDRKAVNWAASNMWGDETHRDWLIIMPTIPKQSWHTHPSHHALEAFLDELKAIYKIEGEGFHLTGFGDGSRAAITYADMFSSLTVTNPMPWNRWEDRYLKRWSKQNPEFPLRILVGEKNAAGLKAAKRVVKAMSAGDVNLELIILEGEDEHLESLQDGGILAEVARTISH